jgi:hypothetical protein
LSITFLFEPGILETDRPKGLFLDVEGRITRTDSASDFFEVAFVLRQAMSQVIDRDTFQEQRIGVLVSVSEIVVIKTIYSTGMVVSTCPVNQFVPFHFGDVDLQIVEVLPRQLSFALMPLQALPLEE